MKKNKCLGLSVGVNGPLFLFIFNILFFFRSLWPNYVALVLSVCSPCLEIADYSSLLEGLLS